MIFKKELDFKLHIIDRELKLEGIIFSNFAYISPIIDGVDILKEPFFEGSFLVIKELQNSITESGNYLLFTSVSGIADDAGWDYIKVIHKKDSIKWDIERDDNHFSYIFDKEQYLREVLKLVTEIKNLDDNFKLEPSHVIYPEEGNSIN